jgi:hypothetical protein
MKTSRKVTLIEQRKLTVIRQDSGSPIWCDTCAKEVWMTGVDQAAMLIGVNVRVLCRLVEDAAIHILEPADGRLLICLPSLKSRVEQAPLP